MEFFQVRNLQQSKLDCALVKIAEIGDEYRLVESKIIIMAFGSYFRVGLLTDEALAFLMKDSFILIDEKHRTIYKINHSGYYNSIGFDDKQFLCLHQEVVVFSESGLIIINNASVRDINFSLLNSYFTQIEFNNILARSVRFEVAGSIIVERSFDELDELVGMDVTGFPPSTRELVVTGQVYDLSEHG